MATDAFQVAQLHIHTHTSANISFPIARSRRSVSLAASGLALPVRDDYTLPVRDCENLPISRKARKPHGAPMGGAIDGGIETCVWYIVSTAS